MTAAVDGTRAHRKKEKRRSLKNNKKQQQPFVCLRFAKEVLPILQVHGTLLSQGSFTHSLIPIASVDQR